MNKERFLDANIPDDMAATIRPRSLADFIGHESLKQNLSVFVSGARSRGEAMDHVLLYGPPGLGKTTLAHIVANELGTNFRATAAPMLTKQGDLAAILTALEPMDVLFIDEIHRLPTAIEEVLYSAMEDFKLDIMLGEGPSAKSVRIDLPPFTLVGATTRTGLLSNPLRDRFGIDLRLSFYSPEDLAKIIMRSANILGTSIDADGALMLAKSARGTPRIANRLLKRARDFASALNRERITAETIKTTLFQLHIDECGLDEIDREYMTAIIRHYAGGPVGIENLGAALSEPADTIEDVIEPYLMQLGFVQRTPRGRVITDAGYRHLGLEK
ncbi:MAG: Holliday junction branch migration DNA helicase RuvB [Alphaproteobacteria bacterium]|nr:Holliday junction branch migration DNA helicase RuvB [Alphaproteobacteria bacterium]MBQ4130058.1 Holliday junction branch migration DNA helicase RuvB [Alphaproteobacteria bacterium]MBQ8042426.1 Holliday junction branch migration DNA helicase RuvB [Alphaproteobacteria bacterium]MBQ8367720.1 Holliday junction branch migration DNA helicase RuvB [Alphaproteobacteria bacterium]MBQ8728843.1 Holliday junction branch migration DNA helicase RuvB [Alphaproteobacteria bacterium]